MPFVRPKARILERSINNAGGAFALDGAVDASYNRFSSFMSVGDTTYVSIVEPGVAFWTGIVTYTAANQITQTTVEESSGTLGAGTSGTKEIMAGPLASTSMFREDISGAIVTSGTLSAYTVSSHRVYGSLAVLHENIIAFTPHVTSGAAPTLNVDGLGAKPLRAAPSLDFLPGVLIQGSPFLALYNHTDDVFYLHGFYGNPYNVPLGAGMDYWGPTTPNSAFAFPAGQAISRSTYAALFDLIGVTYGAGDGSSTFNLPNKSGKVSAMKEAVATLLTAANGGVNGATLGAFGGNDGSVIPKTQLPDYNLSPVVVQPTFATNAPHVTATRSEIVGAGSDGPFNLITGTDGATISPVTPMSITIPLGGGGLVRPNLQPTIVCNYIMRVL